ncbi:hypothetical protein EB233_31500 [Mesorhizobium erdmanii]|uniref:Uncharacterized protein n=1 Tax=Mesorhizobium erdmanii TaxID=1777866 RepID=A0A6M7UTR8_9HYPH|nr:hypothetical protein A8146_11275 [Mesorhizobium loti]QKC79397.1 hypothetical protein EB233_31500 [Mesorhizobium erdmanii]
MIQRGFRRFGVTSEVGTPRHDAACDDYDAIVLRGSRHLDFLHLQAYYFGIPCALFIVDQGGDCARLAQA